MAGYTVVPGVGKDFPFHVGDANVVQRIKAVTHHRRAITIQVDGDEYDAVMWGLENYKKGQHGLRS